MRISDWSSDVCSSDLYQLGLEAVLARFATQPRGDVLRHHVRLQVGLVRLLGHPLRTGIAAGVAGHVHVLHAAHAAAFVGGDEAAFGLRQFAAFEPRRAGQAGHEQDQVGGEFAAFGHDLAGLQAHRPVAEVGPDAERLHAPEHLRHRRRPEPLARLLRGIEEHQFKALAASLPTQQGVDAEQERSEEHTSELQSLMRISYAVFCLKKKKQIKKKKQNIIKKRRKTQINLKEKKNTQTSGIKQYKKNKTSQLHTYKTTTKQ